MTLNDTQDRALDAYSEALAAAAANAAGGRLSLSFLREGRLRKTTTVL